MNDDDEGVALLLLLCGRSDTQRGKSAEAGSVHSLAVDVRRLSLPI